MNYKKDLSPETIPRPHAACPWCNGTDLRVGNFLSDHFIVCTSCHGMGPAEATEELAWEKWNTRINAPK